MRRFTLVVLACALVALSASAASAQTERTLGVVIGYPATVGVEWQASRKIAVRFDADYSQSSNEASTDFDFSRVAPGIPVFPDAFSVTTRTRTRYVDLGVALLVDLHRNDDLRVYLAPRVGIGLVHNTYETEFDGPPALLAALTFPADSESSSTSPGGGVALGASHDVTGRFRVFGEAGFNYLRRSIGGRSGDDVNSSTFGLRGGVGAVILF